MPRVALPHHPSWQSNLVECTATHATLNGETTMNLPAPAARCACAMPTKVHAILPLLLMALLYGVSSLPGKPLPDNPATYSLFQWMPPWLQNTLHIPAFAALAWAWHWTLGAWMRARDAHALRIQSISAFAIASGYGVFDEWHQFLVPGRHASLLDVALDVAGAALGIWLAACLSGYVTRGTAEG